jgi:hypothetical protein
MPHQQRKQGQTRMNINTETWEDGRIVYTFTRAKIDYTVVPQEKGQFDVYKRNNQRGSISLDCYANGVSFQGKKAPKFIIPIFELRGRKAPFFCLQFVELICIKACTWTRPLII